MSTNAKAWDVKAGRKAGQNTQQYDSQQQNAGKCDNCRYRVSKQERIHYDCLECGIYIVSTAKVRHVRQSCLFPISIILV